MAVWVTPCHEGCWRLRGTEGSGAPPLCPWALSEAARTTKPPLTVGGRGGPPGGASLSGEGMVPRLLHGAGDVGVTGHCLGGLGCPAPRGEPVAGLKAPVPQPWHPALRRLLPGRRGVSGHAWGCPGVRSVVVVSNYSCLQFHLTSPLRGEDAFGPVCPLLGVELRTGLSSASRGAGGAQHLQDPAVRRVP